MRQKNNWLKSKIMERFDWQTDFADAVGLTDSMVSKVINGRRPLTEEQIKVWAGVLNCGHQELAENCSQNGNA